MKKIILFGATGMLGSYLNRYLGEKYCIETAPRWSLDAAKATSTDVETRFYVDDRCVLINAVGIIPQRGEHLTSDMIRVNALWPHELQKIKEHRGCEVVNITTDCVFNGEMDIWSDELHILHENTPHDATSVYGKTKSLGENPDITNIRTSIIGEEVRNKVSLLEWAKKNKGNTIDGYTTHIWNGVTCLELAKIIDNMIQNNHFWNGVRHVKTPYTLSKADMLEQINEVYELGMKINRVETEIPVYRALTTLYNDEILTTKKTFKEQLRELKEYSLC